MNSIHKAIFKTKSSFLKLKSFLFIFNIMVALLKLEQKKAQNKKMKTVLII